jgi:hypothetical protein
MESVLRTLAGCHPCQESRSGPTLNSITGHSDHRVKRWVGSMRATILHCLLGIATCIPVFDVIAQENSAMTTSCSVKNASWRPANTFTVEAKREIYEPWYYEDEEITEVFKEIASQTVHDPDDEIHSYDYTFKSYSGEQELKCTVEFMRRGISAGRQLKFISASCQGDRPYECKKNYNDGKQKFVIRFTIVE